MKQITFYIKEGLKIGSKTKVNTIRYLSTKDIPDEYFRNFTAHEGDLDKLERNVKDAVENKKDPKEIIKDIKYKEQLFIYWYNAIIYGWERGYDAFRQEIIDKKYSTEDEIDACAIEIYNQFNDRQTKDNILNYLDRYNVKIKE